MVATVPPNYRIAMSCYTCSEGYPFGMNDPRWHCTKHRRIVSRHDTCDDYYGGMFDGAAGCGRLGGGQ